MAKPVSPRQNSSVDVRFFTPPSDLAACFTMIYRLDIRLVDEEPLIDYIHPEWANLRFTDGSGHRMQLYNPGDPQAPWVEEARFQVNGPTTFPLKFEIGNARIWGIGLRPLGWAHFVGCPASDWVNTVCDGEREGTFKHLIPLKDLVSGPAEDEEQQWENLVTFFRDLKSNYSVLSPAEEERIAVMQKTKEDPYLSTSDEFAEATGMHKRTLERLCKKYFGFAPRTLIRRRRMIRSLTDFMLAEGENWSNSIDCHYHDQPHFVREFRTFMGMSPSEYAALPHPIYGAFLEERRRVWGSPVRMSDAEAVRHFGEVTV